MSRKVLIVMGSDSDREAMVPGAKRAAEGST